MKPITFILLLFPFLASCQGVADIKLDDGRVNIEERLFSPNKEFVVYELKLDNGAMGSPRTITALVNCSDTLGSISESIFPCLDLPFYSCYYADQWLTNDTFQVFLNERSFAKMGIPFKDKGFELNGIHMKVVPNDFSYDYAPNIEHVSFSEDKTRVLVAYRYKGASELNVSVVKYGDDLPRYGNIFTSTQLSWNPIRFGQWKGDAIELWVDERSIEHTENVLNDRVETEVKFVVDTTDTSMISHVPGWFNKPLSNTNVLREHLAKAGNEVEAEIVERRGQQSPDGQTVMNYWYEYEFNGWRYKSYFRVFGPRPKIAEYELGDKIHLLVDEKSGFVHLPKDEEKRR